MNKEQKKKNLNISLRAKRARKRIKAISSLPRLSVFRSIKHVYAQVIDDQENKTIVAVSDKEVKGKGNKRVEVGLEMGKLIGKKAQEKGIKQVVFDKGRYKYHGVVKNIAEGAREAGLKI